MKFRLCKDLVLSECQEIVDKIKGKIDSLSFYDLEQFSYCLMNTLANILNVISRFFSIVFSYFKIEIILNQGLCTPLNSRFPELLVDVERANQLPDYYDTDIENYWTNPSIYLSYFCPKLS